MLAIAESEDMTIHIKNGRVIDPANGIDAVQDLFIVGGKIAAIGAAPAGFIAEQVIDATGLIVAPGLVDLSARLREPGFEYKATLESELEAAMRGGVTSLVCPPDTDPVLDEAGLVEMLKQRAKLQNKARVYPLGALTVGLKGGSLTEMAALTNAGCIGFSQAEVMLSDTNTSYCVHWIMRARLATRCGCVRKTHLSAKAASHIAVHWHRASAYPVCQ
jgi:dihydroorotase